MSSCPCLVGCRRLGTALKIAWAGAECGECGPSVGTDQVCPGDQGETGPRHQALQHSSLSRPGLCQFRSDQSWPGAQCVNVLCRPRPEHQTDNTIIRQRETWPPPSADRSLIAIMGQKSTKMEHGLSQADLNFLVKNTNRSKKEIKVGLRLKVLLRLTFSFRLYKDTDIDSM